MAATKILYKKKEGFIWIAGVVSSPGTTNAMLQQLTTPLDISSWAKDVTVTYPEGPVNKQDFLGEDTNGFQNQSFEEDSWNPAKIMGTLVFSPIDTDVSISRYAAYTGNAITSGEVRYQLGSSAAAYLRSAKCIVFALGAARTLINEGGGYGGGATLTVLSTAGFPNAGSLIVGNDQSVTYTGRTATTFTGVSGGSAQADQAIVVSATNSSIILSLNNAMFTKIGDVTLTGNTWQCPFEATCLPADFRDEVQQT